MIFAESDGPLVLWLDVVSDLMALAVSLVALVVVIWLLWKLKTSGVRITKTTDKSSLGPLEHITYKLEK